jgi:hypothetical protein
MTVGAGLGDEQERPRLVNCPRRPNLAVLPEPRRPGRLAGRLASTASWMEVRRSGVGAGIQWVGGCAGEWRPARGSDAGVAQGRRRYCQGFGPRELGTVGAMDVAARERVRADSRSWWLIGRRRRRMMPSPPAAAPLPLYLYGGRDVWWCHLSHRPAHKRRDTRWK